MKAQSLQEPELANNEKIFSIIFQEDELTWQNIIYDLVQTEQMNPWDVNIRLLSAKFLEKLKELKELDFRITGKVVLCAALMLKIKSNKLVQEDLLAADRDRQVRDRLQLGRLGGKQARRIQDPQPGRQRP